MISVLILLGWIALIVGVVLVILAYASQRLHLLRPGWGLVIAGVVFLLLGYLLIPLIVHPGTADVDVDGMRALASLYL